MTGSSEMAGPLSGSRAYRAGVAIAAVTALLTMWSTIVRDDGSGAAFFMVIMALGVGWFAAGFRAAGMARTMAGVGMMQAALGALMATDPSVTNRAAVACAFGTVLWLVSGAFFRVAAKG